MHFLNIKDGKNDLGEFGHFFGYSWAMGDMWLNNRFKKFREFWSDNILVLLCEGPKPQNSMIYGFWGLVGTLIYGFHWLIYGFKYTKNTLKYTRK